MTKNRRFSSWLWARLLFASFLLLNTHALAQEPPQNQPEGAAGSKDLLGTIKFRNLGPAVGGGRVTSVVGISGQPNVYYIGGAAGGVFKTIDGGVSWKAIFEKEGNASIGAIALAPSNPNVVWVGTGESNPRNDVVTGHGVYMSPDGGASWRFMGLENVGQISSIVINPTNPDIVYVGALGHVWGPNADRGVFRTIDGGKNWQKVLYVDDKTGVSDLVMDPGNPMVLFAGLWNYQRFPWMMINGGNNSGIYRSTDGGATWKKLAEGLPKPPIGRIGLAIARSNPYHVYALIDSKTGVLWDSTDLGDHWKQVSNNHMLDARPFYFTQMRVAPDNEDRIYFLSFNLVESDDGGKTAHKIDRGVHVDHHALWIDPADPKRIINGNDGGVYLSTDAGHSWSYLDNIPIEQFYMVATDDNDPYLLCGGLQDNNGWCGPSNTLSRGGNDGSEWWTAVGGDGEYVVPAGHQSNIIYADSQGGSIVRMDSHNGMRKFVRPYLADVGQMAPSELKYRFNWTSPIAVGPNDPNTVYLGGNVLFKSTDGGTNWTPISGDLTRNDKSKQLNSGGPVELDLSGAETYDTILSISISPTDPNSILVGTDDGQVQMTHDGGQHWSNITPKNVPQWGRAQQVEISPFSPETVYVAMDLHELDNNAPYVFRTHDGGKTWTAITNGLRPNEPARVVREDPNKRGFLVLGTDTGLYYSADDGDHWTPLKGNFPTVPIYDIKFHKKNHDLIVATHGRGLFVLDNVTPLEEMTTQTENAGMQLFSILPAFKWYMWSKRGFSDLTSFTAPNPPNGAMVDYFLKSEIEVTPEMKRKQETPVKITITDQAGRPVRTYYGTSKYGFNRAVWDMRYDGPTKLNFRPESEGGEEEFAGPPSGPPVVPGTYKVAVTVNGKAETQEVRVEPDPRFPADMQAFEAQTKAALQVRDELSALNDAINRLEGMRSQLKAMHKFMTGGNEPGPSATYASLAEQATALEKKLKDFEQQAYNTDVQPDSMDSIRYLEKLHDRVQSLQREIASGYDQAPSPLLLEEMKDLHEKTQAYLQNFNNLLQTDVAAFNKQALEKGASTLFTGTPIELKKASAAQ
jgi:photosystem II stability/assembly factor-like uncharacterized protein/DNA-binding protein YbaB